jgi:hypothetical protein
LLTEQINKNKMAITTTSKFGKSKSLKKNFKTGGELSKPVNSMSYSELNDYITKNYLPKLENVSMSFSIYGTGFDYDYKDPKSKNLLLNYYREQADYTEKELDERTNYKIKDWEIVRKEIDPETDEIVYEQELTEDSADNTYNMSYLGITDLNYRFYHDEDYDKWFVVIHPHISGDIRGNYGEPLILEGDDKDELFYRFYENFISGGANIYFNFTDGSEVVFDSEQDSDIFRFVVSENNEIEKGTFAQKLIDDFDSINDTSKSDVFLEEIVEQFIKDNKTNKKSKGGNSSSENPSVCIEIVGTGETKWFDLTEYNNGADIINAINTYLVELNKKDNKNRTEYIAVDWSGFGEKYFSEYMGEENFDNVLEAWDSFKTSNFPISVVYEFMEDTKNSDMDSAIDSMNKNLYGVFNSYSELAKNSDFDLDIDDVEIDSINKKKIATEYANKLTKDMSDSEILSYSQLQDEVSYIENGIFIFNDDISEHQLKISELSNEIITLESQIDESDEDDIEVITDLIVDKKEELEKEEKKVSQLEKNVDIAEKEIKKLLKNAKEITYSEVYNDYYEKIDNNLYDFLSDNYESFTGEIDSDFLREFPFLKVNYDELGKRISKDFLVIETENNIYLFKNYGNGGKVLSTSKPSKKYKYFVIELDNKFIMFGSESRDEAENKKDEILKNNSSLRISVYKRDYAERRLNLDVDNSNYWISDTDLINSNRVSVNKINKKSLGGWLEKQWFEADFGDGVGATRFFEKGGKTPAYWNSGENIKVFDYKTQNFDICGGAVDVFNDAIKEILSDDRQFSYNNGFLSKKNEIFGVEHSAEFLDTFFGIEKEIIYKNSAKKYQIEYALTNLLQAQMLFGMYNKFEVFKFSYNHIFEMIKRLDKSELKFSDGGKVLYDHEGDMAKSELQKIEKYAKYLDENITTETQLMAWVQSKISRMATDMGDVKHYMEYQINNKKAMGGLVVGGIAVIVGSLLVYFLNKNRKSMKGGNELHTRLGWIQDQKKRSKQEHEIKYQKKKLKK